MNFNDDDEGTNEGTNEDAVARYEREILVDTIIAKEGFVGLFAGYDKKADVLIAKKRTY